MQSRLLLGKELHVPAWQRRDLMTQDCECPVTLRSHHLFKYCCLEARLASKRNSSICFGSETQSQSLLSLRETLRRGHFRQPGQECGKHCGSRLEGDQLGRHRSPHWSGLPRNSPSSIGSNSLSHPGRVICLWTYQPRSC